MHMTLANLASRPLVALLAYAGWAMVLVLFIGGSRAQEVLAGKKRPNEFPSGVPHGGDRYWRLNRAHINTVENLPIFAAIVLAGAALGVSSEKLARLAEVAFVARVLQSSFHIYSGRSLVVNFRFAAYVTQLVCFAWMIAETLHLASL